MSHQFKTLDEVKQLFDHWRSTRTKRGKVPEHLWQHVQPLMKQHNITAIAHALGVNTTTIKENLPVIETSPFIEVSNDNLPNVNNAIEPVMAVQPSSVELHHPNGSVLKIASLPDAQLSMLINHFIQ